MLIGRMFHCTPNGSYRSIQCLGSVCYCVDRNGKARPRNFVPVEKIAALHCSVSINFQFEADEYNPRGKKKILFKQCACVPIITFLHKRAKERKMTEMIVILHSQFLKTLLLTLNPLCYLPLN